MKLENGTECQVHSTGSILIDNLNCVVVGVVTYFGECGGNLYVVKPVDGRTILGYETFCIPDVCLKITKMS